MMRGATVIALCAAVLSASCSGTRPIAVMGWSEYRARPIQWPYVLEFDSARGSLLYYGARHIHAPDDPQVEEITRLWKAFRPTRAFYEGWRSAVEPTLHAAAERQGEPGVVRFLAAQDATPVASLDPRLTEEVRHLKTKFSAVEVKVFYALRPVAELAQVQPDADFDAVLEEVLRTRGRVSGLDVAPQSVEALTIACKGRLPGWSGYRAVPLRWFDPARSDTFLNSVSRASSEYRDREIVRTLSNSVIGGSRVFAVVGGSHVVMQEPALRALLGVRARRPTKSSPSGVARRSAD